MVCEGYGVFHFSCHFGPVCHLAVFQVEMVGDSYVAATGIPVLCEEHAALMVQFGHTCLVGVNQLTEAK